MLAALVLLLVVEFAVGAAGVCTTQDRAIWEREGHTWPHRFRDFGGALVSTPSYERSVRAATGLTEACAACYGEAYNCGYDHCKWSCYWESDACNTCLHDEGCIERCNRCTGFS